MQLSLFSECQSKLQICSSEEIYAFFLLVGEKIIWKMCWYLYKENLHKRYRYGIYTLKM